jgi:hypothetical protein
MVDYSKWDKFGDTESDEDESSNSLPRVHHFKQPTSVTIGPNGLNYQADTSKISSTTSTPPVTTLDHHDHDINQENSSISILPSVSPSQSSPFQRYETPTHSWQQTRYEITIWIKNIPFHTKNSDLKVNLYQKNSLCIEINSLIFFQKTLKYEISHDIDSDGIDWEIISSPSSSSTNEKQIKIIFQKHQYLPGSAIWWNACFLGDEEIDVMQIPERKLSTNEKIQKQQFSNVWKEANEIFQKKIQGNETSSRCSIELPSDETTGTGTGGRELEEKEEEKDR